MGRRKRSRTGGFSLPELLIAFVIFGFVATAAVTGTLLFSRMFASVASTADLQRQERWLEGNLGRDVRMTPVADFALVGKTELALKRSDGVTIEYNLVSNGNGSYKITRSQGGVTQTVIDEIDAWEITLPTDQNGFTMALTMQAVNTRGRLEPYTLSASFSPRL